MSGEATIRRGVRNARYSAIPNHVLEDKRLSMDARWLLCYLLSKPDNWTVVVGDISNKGGCGRDKVRKMIAELVDAGYAERDQTRDEGRFSATSMVIFDEPRSAAERDEAESVASLPQTEMPATAKPSPVTPSPAKSAHSNNLDSANTDYQQEGDAREAVSEGEEDPKAVARAFRRWYGDWPTRKVDSAYAAERAWQALTPAQRADCIAKSPLYIERANATKGVKVPWAGPYLTGRDWEKLDDPKSEIALPVVHGPFTRAWHARRCAELLMPISSLVPQLAPFLRRIVDAGGEKAEATLRDHRRKYGWPKVNTMDERAGDRKGVTVPPSVFRVSEAFEKAHREGDLAQAWERLFDRLGLPWPPVPPGVEWLFFPPVPAEVTDLDMAVAEAWAAFETNVGEGRNDDAA
ncbi:helix-turn-helix domain-containing protein [Agrobacterium genomosp. 3 str. CIP 111-78]|uniref:Helix-turn-helix domain-containing protein n=1 Tax=Agrobacterium tumefaciens TaxID=358 RepID=A0AAE6BRK2_AGRTU|nr:MULTISPECIES: helix-turn-helix domain-containing protein [Agrobacterium tumefaciens complex]MCA2372217.1 helix-turn-helix domain-containing protein [Agrobacterium tomkonis CIP 111-78]QCM02036.1 helix-turn-helix domain-containing protein [Agrobacterium tumefaciens]